MTRILAIATTTALIAFAPASAQEMTVEQLVAMAIQQSPDLAAARSRVTAASALVPQAGVRPNPMLSSSHERGEMGMNRTAVGLEWPLALRRRSSRAAVARGEADLAALTVRERERLLASAIREQAGRLLAARRNLEVITEALTTARRMRELLDRRVTEGGSPKLDANLATVQALRLEADVALATGEVQAATIELRAIAGLPADAPVNLADTLETVASVPFLPRLTPAAALDARPDIRSAIAQIGLADVRIDAARREGLYDVTFAAGYTRSRFGFDLYGFTHHGQRVLIEDVFHTATIGARITLPFFDRNAGTVAATQAQRAGAEASVTAAQREARAEMEAALAREREARRAVELYAGEVRTLARQNVDVMLEGYDLGRFPLSDVLAEQRRYLDVEAGYTAVLARVYQARAAVATAFGEIP
jgi:cobalt-zinc-cadmium efflux system outer membrane protein